MSIVSRALIPGVLALCIAGCVAGLKPPPPHEESSSVLVIQKSARGHVTSIGAKSRFCRDKCWQPYRDCEELKERSPQEFSAMDQAVEWLNRHRNGVLAGSIVVIAGAAFVVAFPPGALMVLVPLAAMS